MHAQLPDTACVPGWQTVTMLEPLHLLPARHSVHAVCLIARAPLVNEPAAHVEHELCIGEPWYWLSAQFEHAAAPASENVPAGHVCFGALPSHACPTGHSSHAVRVSGLPPLVNEPAPQAEHELCAGEPWYRLSAAQFEHAAAPASENVPAGHVCFGALPSHACPAGHTSQLVRV